MLFNSFRQIKAAIKEDESILLTKKTKGLDISRAIYDIVQNGVKGSIKKELLSSALSELAVSYYEI
jgi:hypothetical protein